MVVVRCLRWTSLCLSMGSISFRGNRIVTTFVDDGNRDDVDDGGLNKRI